MTMIVPRSLPTVDRGRRPSSLVVLALILGAGRGASAFQAAAGSEPSASTPSRTEKVADLTGRYRFTERYTTDDAQAGPGVVGSYRVAIREVIKDSVDTAQGAPKRTESTRQVIYSERPSEMVGSGSVASSTRVVERYRARPEDAPATMGARPLDGLTSWIRPKVGELPLIIGLIEGRTLTEYEFDALSHQVFVPHLTSLLPSQVVRVGDSWRIPRKAAQALLGDPWIQADMLVGKLAEVRKEVDGPRQVASIGVTGRVNGPGGDTAINAEVLFTFQPSAAPKGPPSGTSTTAARPGEDTVESRGAITEVRLARSTTGPVPGPGRLRFQSNRELTLHRQLGVGAAGAAPPLVSRPPSMTEGNSWLAHIDPAGRYMLIHPQELLPPDKSQPPPGPDTTLLIRTRREGLDMLQVEYVPRTLAPDDLKKELAEKFGLLKMEVLKGGEEWLPEADWPRMKVHRIEAAVKVDPKAGPAARSPRIHFDGYLILFGQSASILAIATTPRESVTPFRQEVEQILKSIQLNPGKPTAP